MVTGIPKIGDPSMCGQKEVHTVSDVQQWLALKTEEGAASQRRQAASRSQKRQGNGFSLQPPGRVPPLPSFSKKARQALC